MGGKSALGKAFILNNGYSLVQMNNAALIAFNPIEEELEQPHFIVAVIYNGVTIISSQRLELKLFKLSETSILNGNGYRHYNSGN